MMAVIDHIGIQTSRRKRNWRKSRRCWSHNKGFGLVCLHMVLTDRHSYSRSLCTLNRAMKSMGIGRKKQRKKTYKPKPYETPKQPENGCKSM